MMRNTWSRRGTLLGAAPSAAKELVAQVAAARATIAAVLLIVIPTCLSRGARRKRVSTRAPVPEAVLPPHLRKVAWRPRRRPVTPRLLLHGARSGSGLASPHGLS